ncbi:MAG TPA: EAL domain-containing protein [Kineosporiaceae bacterium]|nr:EAL domain-containing protein [Kineosporiaceae bacterium]
MPEAYGVTSVLFEDAAGGLYRGVRARDGAPVVVKFVRTDPPVPGEAERLRHEYETLCRLDGGWVPRAYGLDRDRGQLRLVLEWFDGELLSGLFDRPVEPGRFLDVAVSLTTALADLHRQGVVHGDLRAGNVLLDSRTGALKLIGFGVAARLSGVLVATGRPMVIEGSPAYMSPEQTGYLNRGIDYRSDLYSLGVVLYEMLTGELPFQAADPVEWAHCHIARPPRPPAQIVPTVQAGLAEVVLKLLAKQPEERYQSALGLLADLQHCREEWTAKGAIELFPLGVHDVSERFLISFRLYGREREVAALTESLDRVRTAGGAELVLVSGYSGIGKSSLVQELRGPVVGDRGYFVSGKYDQYQRDIPYSTLAQAFQDLLRQILTESEERVRAWKARLQEALGAQGRLIVDLVPQLELLIGPQPPLPALSPIEAQRRLQLLVGRFLGVFARSEHPLVLFLDDLQWIDHASLALMTYLLSGTDVEALLLIGAYRDNEVGPAHPLTDTLERIRRSEVRLSEVVLGPLPTAALTQFVADTLRRPVGTVVPLARLIQDKTEGNPFFAIHFLTTLHQEGLLLCGDGGCQWDLDAIRGKGFTDNVVELMLGRLKRLSGPARHVLILAACLAGTVEVATLALLTHRTQDQLHLILREALDDGLLSRVDGRYTFLHDRVQEAAYALLNPDQRSQRHLRIGRALLAHTPQDRLGERIFEIVGQLNRGTSLIASADERQRLTELNLVAGRRAKAASAFASALAYLTTGTDLLSPGSWESSYDLTFALHVERAECAYLVGDHACSEEVLTAAFGHARTVLDRARVYRLRGRLYQITGRWPDALNVAVEALRLFGVSLPESDETILEDLDAELRLISGNLAGQRIADLAEVPFTDDTEVRALIGLLTEVMGFVHPMRPLLRDLLSAKCVRICLQKGHTEESPLIYGQYALLLVRTTRDIPAALEFSETALRLNERSPAAAAWKGKLLGLHALLIGTWRDHLAGSLPMLEEALQACLDAGDFVIAGNCSQWMIWLPVLNGDPLEQVARIARRLVAVSRQCNDGAYHVDRLLGQFVLCLQGRTRSLTDLGDGTFDEAGAVTALEETGFGYGIAFYRIAKQMAAFLAGRHGEALEWADRVAPLLGGVSATPNAANYYFYRALTLAALSAQADQRRRQELIQELGEPLEQLRFCAEFCPDNHAGPYLLVCAELARVEGRDSDAMRLYDQAISSAQTNGFVHQEALTAELAAAFYGSRGADRIAGTYLREARDCYARWGAHAKVHQLDQQHPGLAESPPLAPAAVLSARAEQFDVLSVVKASQAISQEIVLPQLQETLIRLALEHAGAQRGYLLLAQGERLTIHARAETEGGQTRVDVLPAVPASPAVVPTALLNYVVHSGESVVLADAATDSLYSRDEYITEHKPCSVLGLPITRQGRLIGILYLENNLVTGAFIPSKLAVLELLAAQAAISLETAQLYTNLQELNASLEAENIERRRAEDEARRLNQQFAFRALHDDLTGLPNRALLVDHLRTALARAQRAGTAVGVLFIDLDDFKSVNDTFGHLAADGFLIEISRRISGCMRGADTAARISGDEFVVVCEDLGSPGDAVAVAQRIRSALSTDIPISDRRIGAPASIGIAVSTPNSTAEDLLRDADTAMYDAKRQGGRRWEPAASFAHTAGVEMLTLETELREALRRSQFRVFYQPTIDLRTNRMVGVEALLRWQHPTRGLLLPQELIHVAERRHLIGAIGSWVLQTACRQAAVWVHRHKGEAPVVAVNISSRQLGDQGLAQQVQQLLRDTGLRPEQLCLEITESQLISADPSATDDLGILAGSGIAIAVDDFGTGFAGFDYLRRLPVTTIKIDKSYVWGLGTDRADTAIVASVITLARNLDLQTIAEGIETDDQRDRLQHLECAIGQGWLWHPALPPEQVDELIRDQPPNEVDPALPQQGGAGRAGR